MATLAQENYLAAAVTTARPQELQLMLATAALRSARRTAEHWQAQRDEEALESLLHAQEVVNAMLCQLNHESGDPLVKRMAGIYLFVFRCLVEAAHLRSEQKLSDAVRILEIERETWRQVCAGATRDEPREPAAPPPARHSPALPVAETAELTLSGGLSLEA